MSQPQPTQPRGNFNVWKFLGALALAFIVLIGAWTWFFVGQARAGRVYAEQVLEQGAGQQFGPSEQPTCQQVVGAPPPGNVESCLYFPGRSPAEVELKLKDGRTGKLQAQ